MASSEDQKLPKLSVEGMVQLDPETCGSSIRWYVGAKQTRWDSKNGPIFGRELETTVHLTDCSRQISWASGTHCGGAKTMLKKLDRAIAELRRMRAAVKKVGAFHETLSVTKRNDVSGVDD